MALFKRRNSDSRYLLKMNNYIEKHVDQHTSQLICKFYGLKYKRPTNIRVYVSKIPASYMNNQKQNASGFQRRWFPFRNKN